MERIGLFGYSMGGFHAYALTAMEPRIAVAAGAVVPTAWRPDIVLSPEHYARGIGDRPFSMFVGRNDGMGNDLGRHSNQMSLMWLMPHVGCGL